MAAKRRPANRKKKGTASPGKVPWLKFALLFCGLCLLAFFALMQAVRELKVRGATVFLITHRPNAIAVADQLVVMHDGHIQVKGPRDAVLAYLQKQAQQHQAALAAQAAAQTPSGAAAQPA